MKYDKYGRLIWNTTVPDWYATNNIDIELDNQGNILLTGAIGILEISQSGQNFIDCSVGLELRGICRCRHRG
jgi:hypothetical protein